MFHAAQSQRFLRGLDSNLAVSSASGGAAAADRVFSVDSDSLILLGKIAVSLM